VAAGLAVPTALLAGAGLSLIVSGIMYNVDKREALRSNPYSYLLSIIHISSRLVESSHNRNRGRDPAISTEAKI
jgi:hypothetical protein